MNGDIDAISLRDYNTIISRLINVPTTQDCWIIAELSDMMVRGGHCYLELIEKDSNRGTTLAKARGIIWANKYAALQNKFESTTQQHFASGLKVMIKVSANFHEQFGFSIVINDINPDYTLGDMARQRLEIIKRLTQEGIIDMNKELEWCEVPQRIAIISAEGAAGYGDFMNQLHSNTGGIQFYTALFSSTMQGANTAPSIISALNRINANIDLFDCVVIIRGGGATSDLNSFDDYSLAANIAQFPIPIITGIGHDRDNTVIDYVSNIRVKTPTAAAEWLVERAESSLAKVNALTDTLISRVKEYLSGAKHQLAYITSSIPLIAENKITHNKTLLRQYAQSIPMLINNRIQNSRNDLSHITANLRQASVQHLYNEKVRLKNINEKVALLSPESTLKRGYSLTLHNGKAVTGTYQVKAGDEITTKLYNKEIKSIVK